LLALLLLGGDGKTLLTTFFHFPTPAPEEDFCFFFSEDDLLCR
jgi:hypothetical protein